MGERSGMCVCMLWACVLSVYWGSRLNEHDSRMAMCAYSWTDIALSFFYWVHLFVIMVVHKSGQCCQSCILEKCVFMHLLKKTLEMLRREENTGSIFYITITSITVGHYLVLKYNILCSYIVF